MDESDTGTGENPDDTGKGLSYASHAFSVGRACLEGYANDSGVHIFALSAGNFAGVVTATEIVGRQTSSFVSSWILIIF